MHNTNQKFDAIVVGSGPGGATVARELTKHGKKVLILEWGHNAPITGSFWQLARDCFIPGKGMYMTQNLLGLVRGITTGGSSRYYCALAGYPPLDRLKKFGVDISTELEEIKAEVPYAPLKDELMSQAALVFKESALDLGYDWRKAYKFIYQDKSPKDCDKWLYGGPQGAKWSALNFVEDAVALGARLVSDAKVSRILTEGKKAVGVEYRHQGQLLQAHADKIIVCAGGIGSPLILRQSGIPGVGYDFFFDPLVFVWGKVERVTTGKGIPMCSSIDLEDEGILLTDHNVPRMLKFMFDMQGFKFGNALSYSNIVPIQAKVRDKLSGHLSKSGWVMKRLADEDRKKLKRGHDHAKKILEHAGAKDIYQTPYIAAHPGGTVKIGEFLDVNLKTEFENLYVCDASVIPHEMGIAPTLTILCLGKRLAKHLLGRDQKAQGNAVRRASSADAILPA